MSLESKRPVGLAQRAAVRRAGRSLGSEPSDGWRRETFRLPRAEARLKARELFDLYPKAAYLTEIESWRELAGDEIEFVLRRLPSAD